MTAPQDTHRPVTNHATNRCDDFDITLEHLGTLPEFLASPPVWAYPYGATGSNYDWTAAVTEVGSTLPYWIDDPYSTARLSALGVQTLV